jgi:E3 ubiquitin-protein ligase UBR1
VQSVYLDQYGEEDPGLRRGRPLYLSLPRYQQLVQLYMHHGSATHIARVRATADRVIRDSFY